MHEFFRRIAHASAEVMGSAWAFILATALILVWLACGPLFDWSDTWQLFVNTGTTVLTFLAVFLIQNTQNRDSRILHLKLDELLRAGKHARTNFAALENLSDEELARHQQEFLDLCDREKEARARRRTISQEFEAVPGDHGPRPTGDPDQGGALCAGKGTDDADPRPGRGPLAKAT